MAHVVTKVNLPERTRVRFEAESNQQRVQKPHDIRSAIPLVDYTNPAKFPPYLFREYPKMPLLDHNRPIIIDESGGILVFYDAADEVEFKNANPEIAEEIERNTPAKTLTDTVNAQLEEIEDLRARLRAAGIEEAPKKPKNALAGLQAPKVAPTKTEVTETASETRGGAAEGEGLRDKLPPNPVPKSGNPLRNRKN